MRKPVVSGYGGQCDKFIPDENGGGTVEWQPGDGTRYVLTSKPLTVEEARLFGAPDGACIVSVGAGGERLVSLVLEPGGLYHIVYVAEKMMGRGVSDYTVAAYTALLNLVLGDEEYGKDLFEEMIKGRG